MFDQYSGLSLGHSSHGLEVTLIVWVIRTCSFSLLDKLVGRNPTGIKANIHIFFFKRKEKQSFFLINRPLKISAARLCVQAARTRYRRVESFARPGSINVAL